MMSRYDCVMTRAKSVSCHGCICIQTCGRSKTYSVLACQECQYIHSCHSCSESTVVIHAVHPQLSFMHTPSGLLLRARQKHCCAIFAKPKQNAGSPSVTPVGSRYTTTCISAASSSLSTQPNITKHGADLSSQNMLLICQPSPCLLGQPLLLSLQT